jgi:hypothetical protein
MVIPSNPGDEKMLKFENTAKVGDFVGVLNQITAILEKGESN